jgi:hypothetical protein
VNAEEDGVQGIVRDEEIDACIVAEERRADGELNGGVLVMVTLETVEVDIVTWSDEDNDVEPEELEEMRLDFELDIEDETVVRIVALLISERLTWTVLVAIGDSVRAGEPDTVEEKRGEADEPRDHIEVGE